MQGASARARPSFGFAGSSALVASVAGARAFSRFAILARHLSAAAVAARAFLRIVYTVAVGAIELRAASLLDDGLVQATEANAPGQRDRLARPVESRRDRLARPVESRRGAKRF